MRAPLNMFRSPTFSQAATLDVAKEAVSLVEAIDEEKLGRRSEDDVSVAVGLLRFLQGGFVFELGARDLQLANIRFPHFCFCAGLRSKVVAQGSRWVRSGARFVVGASCKLFWVLLSCRAGEGSGR